MILYLLLYKLNVYFLDWWVLKKGQSRVSNNLDGRIYTIFGFIVDNLWKWLTLYKVKDYLEADWRYVNLYRFGLVWEVDIWRCLLFRFWSRILFSYWHVVLQIENTNLLFLLFEVVFVIKGIPLLECILSILFLYVMVKQIRYAWFSVFLA